ncbi:MAG: hypothetical protein LBO82_10770, partial [Synergistaceae bacterium]|nr:hypothetical protein [Synergistaceae bacterium]
MESVEVNENEAVRVISKLPASNASLSPAAVLTSHAQLALPAPNTSRHAKITETIFFIFSASISKSQTHRPQSP